ncbi:MAG: enoyl-CoA hydratase-related protein [Bradyrhizobium sp.]
MQVVLSANRRRKFRSPSAKSAVTADEAVAMGLINRVLSAADLPVVVNDMTRRIAQNAPLTISAAKLAIDVAQDDDSGKDISAVENAVARCFVSEDYKEGRRAFSEKRTPIFKGA